MPDLDTNTPLRMWIALTLLRAWNSGSAGFDATVIVTIHEWVDAGMVGPIPWPDSPFFDEWAKTHGFSRVNDSIGFKVPMRITTTNA